MREEFELATTTPHDEPCAQVGQPNFQMLSKIEARVLIGQLERIHGPASDHRAFFKVISCPHEFGTYSDVAVVYNDDFEESENYMLAVENGIPDRWDETAIKELTEAGYFHLMEEAKEVEA